MREVEKLIFELDDRGCVIDRMIISDTRCKDFHDSLKMISRILYDSMVSGFFRNIFRAIPELKCARMAKMQADTGGQMSMSDGEGGTPTMSKEEYANAYFGDRVSRLASW